MRSLSLALAVLLCGCVAPAVPPDNAIDQFVTRQVTAAAELEEAGRLYDALMRWSSVQGVVSDTMPQSVSVSEVRDNLRRLENMIAQRTATALAQAQKRLRAGQHNQARLGFLKVLALQPDHAQALEALRRLEVKRVNNQQAQKSEAENETRLLLQTGVTDSLVDDLNKLLAAAKYRAALNLSNNYPQGDGHAGFKALKTRALVGLAEQEAASGRLEQAVGYYEQASTRGGGQVVDAALMKIKKELSRQHLVQGVRLLARDPEQAVVVLQRAVDLDRQNTTAQNQLARAQKIAANLQRLRAAEGN